MLKCTQRSINTSLLKNNNNRSERLSVFWIKKQGSERKGEFEKGTTDTILWGNTAIFLDDSSMIKCNHNCDQVLIKSSWGSAYSIHLLVSSCFDNIGVNLRTEKMSNNTKFSSFSSCYVYENSECAWAFKEYILSCKKLVFNFLGINFFEPKSNHQHENQPCIRACILIQIQFWFQTM